MGLFLGNLDICCGGPGDPLVVVGLKKKGGERCDEEWLRSGKVMGCGRQQQRIGDKGSV